MGYERELALLKAVPMGRGLDGTVWHMPIEGQHPFIAAATGYGKGSWIWSMVLGLVPAWRAGTSPQPAVRPAGASDLGQDPVQRGLIRAARPALRAGWARSRIDDLGVFDREALGERECGTGFGDGWPLGGGGLRIGERVPAPHVDPGLVVDLGQLHVDGEWMLASHADCYLGLAELLRGHLGEA